MHICCVHLPGRKSAETVYPRKGYIMNTTTIIINGLEVKGELSAIRALLGIAEETSVKGDAPKAPKTPKTPKVKNDQPKAEEPQEAPKAEFSYTKGGAIIQYADNHTIKANNLRRVNNAIARLEELGFVVAWKRIGGWVHIYHYANKDGMTKADFVAALDILPEGWEMHYGAKGKVSIVDKNMLKDYADNFKA